MFTGNKPVVVKNALHLNFSAEQILLVALGSLPIVAYPHCLHKVNSLRIIAVVIAND